MAKEEGAMFEKKKRDQSLNMQFVIFITAYNIMSCTGKCGLLLLYNNSTSKQGV